MKKKRNWINLTEITGESSAIEVLHISDTNYEGFTENVV